MSSLSPASILFSSDGYELAVTPDTAVPAGTRALLVSGSDGANARALLVDSAGRQIVSGAGTAGTAVGGVVTIQGVSGGTVVPVNGTVTANVGSTNGLALDTTLAKLTVSPGAALGSNTVAMTGGSVTTASPTYTTGQINAFSLTTAGALRVDSSATTQPISGTVTALNSSVSTTATAPPGSATYIGGSVTTAGPTYTTGQMNALSLTTAGALRVDSSATTQPVSGTVTANIGTTNGLSLDTTLAKLTVTQGSALGSNTQALMGGSVTTAAPAYTSGNVNPLSLTTAGSLRVDGYGGTFPISGTVTALNSSVSTPGATPPAAATYIGGSVTTAAPSYTTGQMNALSLTTGGALRTQDVSAVSAGSTTAGQNGQLMQAATTTAAPTYTTGQTNPLSLTTAGALRIDGSSTTQPVSGTVTANAGTGNFNMVGTGTAGTPAGGVLTVQGAAGGKPLAVTTDVSSTAAITSVTGSVSNTSVLATNTNRVLATVFNATNKTMYIAMGATASTSSYTVQILPSSYWELPASYTGALSAVWGAGVSGKCLVTELT